MSDLIPNDIDEHHWEEACRRADAIREFLKHQSNNATTRKVVELADELGLSQATAYRLIKLFKDGGTVTSLVNRKPGRPMGYHTLDDRLHQIISTTIAGFHLKRTQPRFSQLVREVQANCISAGYKPPHWRTIKSRLEAIDIQKRAKKRGETQVVKSTTAIPGKFSVSRALETVQIDHTKADVFVVDEETRAPIGRPWLTLAMDIRTRMVTGFYLTMEAPSRLSTSLCLLHSVFDKSAWLRERNINELWPIGGLPEKLHVDNGADFRSRSFSRGCQDAGIKIEWRPPAQPHFGGHIERLIGTQMGALHLLPGTTFSNIQERGDYDAKRHSALTLRDLERYIALEIIGHYHHSIHRSLGRPPMAVWQDCEGSTPLRFPPDRMRFWLTFLPEEERTLRPDGIHLFGLRYWSPALSADIGRTEGRLLVKYDPRDMSHVFVRRASGNFVEARYADMTLPAVSLREVQIARRTLLEKGRREVDMRSIIRTAMAQRELVRDAIRRTASLRRGREVSRKSNTEERGDGLLRGVDSSKPIPLIEDMD